MSSSQRRIRTISLLCVQVAYLTVSKVFRGKGNLPGRSRNGHGGGEGRGEGGRAHTHTQRRIYVREYRAARELTHLHLQLQRHKRSDKFNFSQTLCLLQFKSKLIENAYN